MYLAVQNQALRSMIIDPRSDDEDQDIPDEPAQPVDKVLQAMLTDMTQIRVEQKQRATTQLNACILQLKLFSIKPHSNSD